MSNRDLSFRQSIIWIIVSTLLVSGSAFMGWLYFLQVFDKRLHDPQNNIVAIIQSVNQAEGLKTGYLAELLQLSADKPTNLYTFDLKESEKKLLTCPLIKKAEIKKILPGTLYIQYDMRTPSALWGDYLNAAIDREGVVFPFSPFFTPKFLPIIYLGLTNQSITNWGEKLKDKHQLQKAFSILDFFQKVQDQEGGAADFFVFKLDLSAVDADSCGERKIVMVLKKRSIKGFGPLEETKVYVKLSPMDYEQNIQDLFSLNAYLQGQKRGLFSHHLIVDFRVSQLAFLKNLTTHR